MELVLATPGSTEPQSSVKVSATTFGREFNEALVHQVITAYMAGGRAGTRAHKSRSKVSGGGIKPWRQKGTGRARAGTIRSPIWRAGGKTFAATPQDHSQKVNKKMYRGAMCSILSELVRQQRLVIVKSIVPEQPKTRMLLASLKDYGIAEALIIVDKIDANLHLAARNIPSVEVRDSKSVDPVSLVKFQNVVVTEEALKEIEEVLG